MNDIPTFGFANDTGEPVIFDIGANEWRDGAGRIVREAECDGVTRSQTVGPGQVAVDAADLREAIDDYSIELDGEPLPTVADHLGLAARAVLAAAEPTHGTDPNATEPTTETEAEWGVRKPDSGQGEPCNECERDPYPDTESSSDDRAADLLTEIFTGGSDTPAAEPDRVTLPDTPWTTVRVWLNDSLGDRIWEGCDAPGEWYWCGTSDLVDTDDIANVVAYKVLAEPPKTDAAKTDAPQPFALGEVAELDARIESMYGDVIEALDREQGGNR